MKWFLELLAFLRTLAHETGYDEPLAPPTMAPVSPQEPPSAPITPNPIPMNPDTLLPWNTTNSLSHENWHNVRVLCDLEGLSHEQKEELCATVWGESEFNTHAKCTNYAYRTEHDAEGNVVLDANHQPVVIKYVASVDNGIAQWNTHYHGSEITPDQAVNNPEMSIRLMCSYWKRGQSNQWVAHSTGRYKQFLGRTL